MKNILLVEDDPFLIDIYSTKLKESGFEVEVASDGEKALVRAADKKFDLVILDIVLPQMDGWEILERLKEQNAKLKIPSETKIIILSNLGQKSEVEKGLKLGATKYLIKAHYTPSEVVEEIKKVIK
ncbi:MAG: response regulator [bacterium]|nr:response regulator [bacterium]